MQRWSAFEIQIQSLRDRIDLQDANKRSHRSRRVIIFLVRHSCHAELSQLDAKYTPKSKHLRSKHVFFAVAALLLLFEIILRRGVAIVLRDASLTVRAEESPEFSLLFGVRTKDCVGVHKSFARSFSRQTDRLRSPSVQMSSENLFRRSLGRRQNR